MYSVYYHYLFWCLNCSRFSMWVPSACWHSPIIFSHLLYLAKDFPGSSYFPHSALELAISFTNCIFFQWKKKHLETRVWALVLTASEVSLFLDPLSRERFMKYMYTNMPAHTYYIHKYYIYIYLPIYLFITKTLNQVIYTNIFNSNAIPQHFFSSMPTCHVYKLFSDMQEIFYYPKVFLLCSVPFPPVWLLTLHHLCLAATSLPPS